jgi:hypothetical protein
VLADSVALDLLLARAGATDWVVYCKPPFGGPEQVFGYLANYTHRIAISNFSPAVNLPRHSANHRPPRMTRISVRPRCEA